MCIEQANSHKHTQQSIGWQNQLDDQHTFTIRSLFRSVLYFSTNARLPNIRHSVWRLPFASNCSAQTKRGEKMETNPAVMSHDIALSTSGSFLQVAFPTTMLGFENLDSRETSAIKVEKIYFPKTKLARLALKLFLYRINSAKAPRRQKVMDYSGCGISRFKRNMRDRSTRLSIYQSAPRFAMGKTTAVSDQKQSNS